MPLFGKRKAVETRDCEHCGKPFEVRPSWQSQKFCSHACYAESIRRIHVTKEELEHWYFDLGMTSIEIAERLDCADGHVRDIMRNYGIKLRDKSDAAIDFPCQPFSEDALEKAYLIGFRLGDLNVRQDMETSRRIQVRSSTTRVEQLNLICDLFKKYGHMNVRTGTFGEWQIECRLDMTFEFLLPKQDQVPNWIQKNDSYFWAFAAGYTDAEGHITTRPNGEHLQAYVEIGSCDIGILRGLEIGFQERGVTCTLSLKTKGGSVDKSGKKMNRDFYRIVITRKSSVDTFFIGVAPYLRHADKVARMARAWRVARS